MGLGDFMTNIGIQRLRKAAAEHERDRACVNCGSSNLTTLDKGLEADSALQGWIKCGDCGAVEFQEDTRNYFQEAVDIWDGRSHFVAGKEHVDALISHCEELHLRLAEMEELLAIERKRTTQARELAYA